MAEAEAQRLGSFGGSKRNSSRVEIIQEHLNKLEGEVVTPPLRKVNLTQTQIGGPWVSVSPLLMHGWGRGFV